MGQKFWQHFLADKDVLDNIADAVLWLKKELWCTDLIEIGPGKWILTELIIQDFEWVKLLEVDSSLKPFISRLIDSHKNAEVIRWDVLKRESKDFESDKRPLVVGNLPYYITSPIFRKFFLEQSHIGGIFLIQNEVADKISTLAKKKS